MIRQQPAPTSHHGERGATLIEFAFVFPVLAFILLAFIDFSLIIAGNSAGSSAARDGARVGILDYQSADVAGSPSNIAIKNAVLARLGNMVEGTPVVTVRCLKADTESTVSCVRAQGFGGVEADRDLLEVSVTWKQITVTPLVNPNHTEVIRMTITGKPDFSPDASPLSVYFDDPDEDGVAAPITVNEPNGAGNNQVVSLTLHRSGDSTPTVTVSLGAAGGTTASGADFSLPPAVVFAPGEKDKTVPVTIIDDDLVEPDELLIVEITAMIVTPTSANAIVGLPTSVRITIHSQDVDTTPPTPSGARTYQENAGSIDGIVDSVSIRFSEPVADPGSWTLVTAPGLPVTELGTPTIGADPRVVVIPVLNAPQTTQATWTLSGTDVKDPYGNHQPTGPLTLTDAARAVLVDVQTVAGADGRAALGDRLQFTFSEPVTVGALGSLVINNNAGNDDISLPGLLGPTSGSGGDYLVGNGNKLATFPVTAQVPAGGGTAAVIEVTLGPCIATGQVCNNDLGTVALPGGQLAFVLSGFVVPDGLAPAMPTTPLVRRLF